MRNETSDGNVKLTDFGLAAQVRFLVCSLSQRCYKMCFFCREFRLVFSFVCSFQSCSDRIRVFEFKIRFGLVDGGVSAALDGAWNGRFHGTHALFCTRSCAQSRLFRWRVRVCVLTSECFVQAPEIIKREPYGVKVLALSAIGAVLFVSRLRPTLGRIRSTCGRSGCS